MGTKSGYNGYQQDKSVINDKQAHYLAIRAPIPSSLSRGTAGEG